ncbi:hypothetical protein HPB48_017135 [Haemaphysalis longicornis]|uniref:Uncharacterized protein n=1 Tax=Haemaphysalis longicornis TaxID=44386 RepID=A0A9J6GIV2_HAELO|nr:hypothetical protein HPB48_017135 [Haemaphysalis longicornis]
MSGHGGNAWAMCSNNFLLFQQVILICASFHGNAWSMRLGDPAAAVDSAELELHPFIIDNLDTRNHGGTTPWQDRIKQAPSPATSSGHGGNAWAMCSNNFFLFQQFSSYSSYKSDNRFLVVLPCPRVVFSAFASLCLLLSGDVETNPEPDIKVLVQGLCDGQKVIQANLSGLSDRLKALEDIVQLCRDQAASLAELKDTTERLSSALEKQQEKLVALEDRMRRNNFVVFGIAETEKETSEELEKKVVVEVLKKKLGVNLKTIERMHKVGKPHHNKSAEEPSRPRPAILKLYDYKEKEKVFNSCGKLKGSGISVGDDYSKETLNKRKLLWKSALKEKDEGSRVRLNRDRLTVDNNVYVWDYSKNSRVRIRQLPKTKDAPPKATPRDSGQ